MVSSLTYNNELEGLNVSLSFDTAVSMPEKATLTVTRITKDNPTQNYVNVQKQLLQDFTGYELSFSSNGEMFTPSISKAVVTIQDTKAGASGKAENVHLYRAAGADLQPDLHELKADIVSPDKHLVVFSVSDSLATIYAVTSVAEKLSTRTEYIFQEEGLKVTAVLSDPAIIPDEAELSVSRITKDNKPIAYAQYKKLLQEGSGLIDIEFMAYDISFVLEGKEVEPTGGQVSMTIDDSLMPPKAEDKLQVFHVDEKTAAKPELKEVPANTIPDKDKTSVAFTAQSFSPYLVLAAKATFTPPSGWTYKEISTTSDTFTNTSYYNSSQPLGIAGNFHIVAFGTATLNSHTNGNVLAKILKANVNFGTDALANELSYIQNYDTVRSTSASNSSHILALGSSAKLTLVDNNNAIAVNGTKLDNPKNIWKDVSTSTLPFINLSSVYSQISDISSTLASSANVNLTNNLKTTSSGGNSCEASNLQLSSADAVGVYNIAASALGNYSYFGIMVPSGSNGTVIINVDCSGVSVINMPVSRLYIGGNKISLSNVTSFTSGRVIWNFINSSGKTITTNELHGTVIAPDATINVQLNLNGSIIAKNVNINAESHRDDFYGKLPYGVTARKVWKDANGNIQSGDTMTEYSVKVQLKQGNTNIGSPVTLNAANNWSYTWTGVSSGVTYTIVETEVLKNGVDVKSKYSISYSTDCGELIVTNKYNTSYVLPNTGAMGASPFKAAGLLLIGLAMLLYLKLRNKADKRISIK